jgi:hypothetical protein
MSSPPLESPKTTATTAKLADDAPATPASRVYAKGERAKADNLLLRAERARTKRAHARGLNALEQMGVHLDAFYRWKIIAALAPSGNLLREASEARDKHSRRAGEYLTVVQAALGLTPENDPDEPQTHWDKGAMED